MNRQCYAAYMQDNRILEQDGRKKKKKRTTRELVVAVHGCYLRV